MPAPYSAFEFLEVDQNLTTEARRGRPPPFRAGGGRVDAVEAFRNLLRPGGVLEWNASEVLDAIIGIDGGSEEWAGWMRGKYLLG